LLLLVSRRDVLSSDLIILKPPQPPFEGYGGKP